MKALPLTALAAAPLLITVGLISVARPAPAGQDEPARLIAVHALTVTAARRQHPPDDAPTTGALAKFTSSLLSTGPNEARSQLSGLSVADGLIQAATVSAYCRDGAAESQVAGLQMRAPAGTLSTDVRRRNPDGSTTIAALRITLPASRTRSVATLDIAVATCAPEQDRPRIILPDLPTPLHDALVRQARQGPPVATAYATVVAGAPRTRDCGC